MRVSHRTNTPWLGAASISSKTVPCMHMCGLQRQLCTEKVKIGVEIKIRVSIEYTKKWYSQAAASAAEHCGRRDRVANTRTPGGSSSSSKHEYTRSIARQRRR